MDRGRDRVDDAGVIERSRQRFFDVGHLAQSSPRLMPALDQGGVLMNIEKIWLQYRARLKAFLQSKVSNPDDVDDLLQEISIKTFAGLNQLRDHSKVQSWLFSDRQPHDHRFLSPERSGKEPASR